MTLVTGIGATDKLNNVYKGFSKVEKTLPEPGNLALWQEEIKKKQIWELTYDDQDWEDQDDDEVKEVADYSYINHVDPVQTYLTLVNTTKKVIKKGE